MRKGMILRALIWLIAFILSVALVFRSGSHWMALIPIAMVLLPVGSIFWNIFMVKSPDLRVAISESSGKGESAIGSVSLEFPGLVPFGRLYLVLNVINDLTGEKMVLEVPVVRSGDVLRGEFELTSKHSGRISITADKLIMTDHFGIIPVVRSADAEAHMTVMPDTFPVEVGTAVFTSLREGDDSRSDRKGNDMTEIFQLRDYLPGDNIHGIHWKLSSKLDKMIYRDPRQYVSNDLLIYWDQRTGSPDQLDALAEAVFSIGQALCQAGIKFCVGHSEMSRTFIYEITDLETMIEHLTGLLRRREAELPDPAELTPYGKVLYFAAEAPEFDYDESMTVFICGEPAELVGNEIVFEPENAEDILGKLEVYEV